MVSLLILAIVCALLMAVSVLASMLLIKVNPFPALGGVAVMGLLAWAIISIMSGNASMVPEYLSYYYTSVEHYEPWDEYIHRTCTREVNCTTDKNGSRSCQTEEYDCSYVEEHPARWVAEDNGGGSSGISEAYYREVVALWRTEVFTDMHRDYHSYDGDKYSAALPDSCRQVYSPRLLGYTTTGSYKNKVKFSKSVFTSITVDSADIARLGLYPSTFSEPLVGYTNNAASDLMKRSNWLHGLQDQMHLSILVFWDKPVDAGFYQDALLVGGNKNEFTVCIGLSKRDSSVLWVKPISWTTNEKLKVEVRDTIAGMPKFDAIATAKYLVNNVPRKFIRRQFKEFEYLPDAETPIMFVLAVLLPLLGAMTGMFIAYRMEN